MNETQQLPISIQPIINYPRAAEVGKTYLMEIDIKQTGDFDKWNYEEEEYPIYCRVDTYCQGDTTPLFKIKTIGEPAVVLHRFGGTYGAAKFLLTAADKEMEGEIRVTLVNGWGVPLKRLLLEDVAVVTEISDDPVIAGFKVISPNTPPLQPFEFEAEVATIVLEMNVEALAALVFKELQGALNTKPPKIDGVDDFWYGLYLLAIAKLLNNKYLRLFSFYFDTLIQQRPIYTVAMSTVAMRIAEEVERICLKSNRIQNSGEVDSWRFSLARHRWEKCLQYYKLGPKQGRVELHSLLTSMIYDHIASSDTQLSFQSRNNLIEDFLQGFYIECLRAFRREHGLEQDYTPKMKLELAEYMAFTEQYAKRQIGLPGRNRQRLIVLRAQNFVKGQPPETTIDIEMAVDSPTSAIQQVGEPMISETVDPSDLVVFMVSQLSRNSQ